jgi:hypothetical protein
MLTLDGDLGGTGFSRCDEIRTLAQILAQAKACATQVSSALRLLKSAFTPAFLGAATDRL